MGDWNLVPQVYMASDDYLRLNVTARELTGLSGYPRGNPVQTGRGMRETWTFLAPEEIAEDITHDWEEYESPATRLAQMVGDVKKAVGTGKQAVQQSEEKIESVKTGNSSFSSLQSMLSKAAKGASGIQLAGGGSGILNYKVDSTLVYKNSRRKQYNLSIPLISYDKNTSEENIYGAIKRLEQLSCPEMLDGMVHMKFPAVFTIRTAPTDLIYIKDAALTAVQPTWKQPYKNGLSINVDLQLTFIDIRPLYRSSISVDEDIIRTA